MTAAAKFSYLLVFVCVVIVNSYPSSSNSTSDEVKMNQTMPNTMGNSSQSTNNTSSANSTIKATTVSKFMTTRSYKKPESSTTDTSRPSEQ
jgi:hypothetical protein